MKHILLCCDHVFSNKQNTQHSHVMDGKGSGWAALVSHKSHAGSHARVLHLASAFVRDHITEEGRSAGQVVASGLSHALPYCEMFQRSQQWLPRCNAMAGSMRHHTWLKILTHSQEAWGRVKDAHHNVWPSGLTAVKNNFRYSDPIKPFSLAVDNPAAQGSQTQPQHLSKRVTPSEQDYEGKKKKEERQHDKETTSLCCMLSVVLTFYADLQPLLLCNWTNRLGEILAAVSGGQQLPEVQRACTTWDFPAGYQSMAPHKHIPGTLWLALIPEK